MTSCVLLLLVLVMLPLLLLLFCVQLLHALEENVLWHLLALVPGTIVHWEGHLDNLHATSSTHPYCLWI